MKLRRFTPKQQDWFQKNREKRPVPVDRENVSHIAFPKGSRFIADFDLTHDQIRAVSNLLFSGKQMQEASEKLSKVLPDDAWHQFFGKWDFLRISNRKD
jgi:hypothetical protein